jgi:hypothetical protein
MRIRIPISLCPYADLERDFLFDADPDADLDPDFYLMWMRIQVIKRMRIRIHNSGSH